MVLRLTMRPLLSFVSMELENKKNRYPSVTVSDSSPSITFAPHPPCPYHLSLGKDSLVDVGLSPGSFQAEAWKIDVDF